MFDYLTELNLKRGRQVDKVYEYWCRASDLFVAHKFGASTKVLKRLRDYLNEVLPERKRGGAE